MGLIQAFSSILSRGSIRKACFAAEQKEKKSKKKKKKNLNKKQTWQVGKGKNNNKTLTVFLVGHLERQVLLSQLVVDLLQVLDVVNGFPQHSRLVHLRKEEAKESARGEDFGGNLVATKTPCVTFAAEVQHCGRPWRRCP